MTAATAGLKENSLFLVGSEIFSVCLDTSISQIFLSTSCGIAILSLFSKPIARKSWLLNSVLKFFQFLLKRTVYL